MNQERLIELYKKTSGGHVPLSDSEFQEYAALRKQEYLDRKAELLAMAPYDVTDKDGKKRSVRVGSVRAHKDDAGDIVGWISEEAPV